jgi:hypothetical protein
VIKGVISDFFGVLTTPLIGGFGKAMSENGLLDRDARPRDAPRERGPRREPAVRLRARAHDRGEFFALLGDALEDEVGRAVPLRDFAEHYFSHLSPNDAMIDHLARVRDERGIRLALLTNNVREWEARWRSMLPVDELFELVVDSAFVGHAQARAGIYELTLERLGPARRGVRVRRRPRGQLRRRAAHGIVPIRFETTEQAIRELDAALDGAGRVLTRTALVRRPGPAPARGQVTHIARGAVDAGRAAPSTPPTARRWRARAGTCVEVEPADALPRRRVRRGRRGRARRARRADAPGATRRGAPRSSRWPRRSRALGVPGGARCPAPGRSTAATCCASARGSSSGRSTRTDDAGIAALAALAAEHGIETHAVAVHGCLHLKTGRDGAAGRARSSRSPAGSTRTRSPRCRARGARARPARTSSSSARARVAVAASAPRTAAMLRERDLDVDRPRHRPVRGGRGRPDLPQRAAAR